MGVRDAWRRFKAVWEAAGAAVERVEKSMARQAATEASLKAEGSAAGECDQYGCTRSAERDGKCRHCWGAIF